MTDRQKKILLAIINEYIFSAEPVGSRTISKKQQLEVGPATIRNEMSDLEDMGFLEQPHTSSGRIPSQAAFRFYVDHMVTPSPVYRDEILALYSHYAEKIEHAEQLIQHTSSIISQLTNCMTFVVDRQSSRAKLSHLQLVVIDEKLAVSLLVADNGQVFQNKVRLPPNISASSIEQLINILNIKLRGKRLSRLKYVAQQELYSELIKYVDHYENLSDLLDKMLAPLTEERIYTSGKTFVLDQPEFRDPDKLRLFLELIDQDKVLADWFSSIDSNSGMQVKIGTEHSLDLINHCTLIASPYEFEGESDGIIGVLGPMRMNYSQIIGLIDFVSHDFLHFANKHLNKDSM